MRYAGRELAHGGQTLRVPELLERRHPCRGLRCDAAVRLGEPIAHGVDLRRELAHLVPLPEDEGAREVTAPGPARLVAQETQRAADEPDLEHAGEQPAR